LIVKVRGHLTFRTIIGNREYDFSDDTSIQLIDFLQILASDIGGEHGQAIFDEDTGSVGPYVAVMLNGRHYNHLPDRLNTIMRDQDQVSVFPPGAGG
jgi:molybdopterin converting factor small subunit